MPIHHRIRLSKYQKTLLRHILTNQNIHQEIPKENLDLKYARWKMGRSEGEVDIVLIDNKLFRLMLPVIYASIDAFQIFLIYNVFYSFPLK